MAPVEQPGARMEAGQEFLKAGRRFIVSGVFALRMTCRKIAKQARQSLGIGTNTAVGHLDDASQASRVSSVALTVSSGQLFRSPAQVSPNTIPRFLQYGNHVFYGRSWPVVEQLQREHRRNTAFL